MSEIYVDNEFARKIAIDKTSEIINKLEEQLMDWKDFLSKQQKLVEQHND